MWKRGRGVVGEVDIFFANKFFPVINSTIIVNLFYSFEPHHNHLTLCLFFLYHYVVSAVCNLKQFVFPRSLN
jgi:hypothetical protein